MGCISRVGRFAKHPDIRARYASHYRQALAIPKKTPADGLRQVARSKGFDEASGGVRYRRCECARRAGQVGCAVARPVSKQSRTLAHQAGANVVDAHGVRPTSHVPVRNRREREPRATLMRAANPPLACPAAVRRLHAIQVAGRSRIHPRPATACTPPDSPRFPEIPPPISDGIPTLGDAIARQ